jgi:Fe-S-cluster-containing hydrogenase component 2
MMVHIKRKPALCYGCRTCQLICSKHLTGSFWPERSSIQVSRNPQRGTIRWSIDSTCDGCKNEKMALCVKYCPYQALEADSKNGKEESENE